MLILKYYRKEDNHAPCAIIALIVRIAHHQPYSVALTVHSYSLNVTSCRTSCLYILLDFSFSSCHYTFICISDTCSTLSSTQCAPCNCDTTGSVSSNCDSKGQCTCKNKYYGPKCQHRDCEMTMWSDWTNCRCGYTDGKTRSRSVQTPAAGEGMACKDKTQAGICTMKPCHCPTMRPGFKGDRCEDRDCVSHTWSAWTVCAPCPAGNTRGTKLATITPTKTRSRGVKVSKVGNGKDCGAPTEPGYCGYRCVHVCQENISLYGTSTYCQYHRV